MSVWTGKEGLLPLLPLPPLPCCCSALHYHAFSFLTLYTLYSSFCTHREGTSSVCLPSIPYRTVWVGSSSPHYTWIGFCALPVCVLHGRPATTPNPTGGGEPTIFYYTTHLPPCLPIAIIPRSSATACMPWEEHCRTVPCLPTRMSQFCRLWFVGRRGRMPSQWDLPTFPLLCLPPTGRKGRNLPPCSSSPPQCTHLCLPATQPPVPVTPDSSLPAHTCLPLLLIPAPRFYPTIPATLHF